MKKIIILIAILCCTKCVAEIRTDSLCSDTCKTKKTDRNKSFCSPILKADTLLLKIGPNGNSPTIPEEKWPSNAKAIPIKRS